MNKEIPLGIKIISVVYGVVAFYTSFISSVTDFRGSIFGFFEFPFFLMMILPLFLAIGLWKTKNWARVTSIILSIFYIVLFFILMVTFNGFYSYYIDITIILVNAIICSYLLFNKKVKEAFA